MVGETAAFAAPAGPPDELGLVHTVDAIMLAESVMTPVHEATSITAFTGHPPSTSPWG